MKTYNINSKNKNKFSTKKRSKKILFNDNLLIDDPIEHEYFPYYEETAGISVKTTKKSLQKLGSTNVNKRNKGLILLQEIQNKESEISDLFIYSLTDKQIDDIFYCLKVYQYEIPYISDVLHDYLFKNEKECKDECRDAFNKMLIIKGRRIAKSIIDFIKNLYIKHEIEQLGLKMDYVTQQYIKV